MVPDTTVPTRPRGVIVTGIVIVCIGWTTYGATLLPGLVLLSHRSPVGALIAGSIGAITALTETRAGTDFCPLLPSGPRRYGVTAQTPLGTSGAVKFTFAVFPVVEIRSGSPNGQVRSKKFGSGAVTVADRPVVCEGTR